MNSTYISSPNVRRNNGCHLNNLIDRIKQGPLGGFDNIDDALICLEEPRLGEGFGRPIVERRAGQ